MVRLIESSERRSTSRFRNCELFLSYSTRPIPIFGDNYRLRNLRFKFCINESRQLYAYSVRGDCKTRLKNHLQKLHYPSIL